LQFALLGIEVYPMKFPEPDFMEGAPFHHPNDRVTVPEAIKYSQVEI